MSVNTRVLAQMLRASSSGVPPAVGAPRFLVKARGARPGRIDSRRLRQLHSDKTVVARGMGKEWAVVQLAIAGNAEAQEQLLAPHTDRLYHSAFALLHNKEDAEDALQDGLFKAFTSLRSFQGRSSFSTWLTRIIINSALMTRRSKSAHPEASSDEILDSQPERLLHGVVDARPDPEKTCSAIEINGLVEKHVRQLPPALQAAFRLRAMNGLSVTESSQVLNISPSAFKSRISRARHRLVYLLQQSLGISGTALMFGERSHLVRNG
jgi:RNA polymerase sigma-70 factor, ECF subfamily